MEEKANGVDGQARWTCIRERWRDEREGRKREKTGRAVGKGRQTDGKKPKYFHVVGEKKWKKW